MKQLYYIILYVFLFFYFNMKNEWTHHYTLQCYPSPCFLFPFPFISLNWSCYHPTPRQKHLKSPCIQVEGDIGFWQCDNSGVVLVLKESKPSIIQTREIKIKIIIIKNSQKADGQHLQSNLLGLAGNSKVKTGA